VWLCVPSQGRTAITDGRYQVAHEGAIEVSKIYAELDERDKIFSSLKIVAEKLLGGVTAGAPKAQAWIEVDTAVDQASVITDIGSADWAYLGAARDFDTSPSEEHFLTDYTPDAIVPLRGKYLKLRVRLNTVITNSARPIVDAMLVESVLGLPIKFQFAPTFLAMDDMLDLNNDPHPVPEAANQLLALENFANGLQAFTLQAIASALHNKKVIIGAPEARPAAVASGTTTTEDQVAKEKYVSTMGIIQVVILP